MQQSEKHQLKTPLNISDSNMTMIASRVLISFTHNQFQCKTKEPHNKLLRTGRSCKLIASGKESVIPLTPLLRFAALLKFCGSPLHSSPFVLMQRGVISEISMGIQAAHILVGYWVGPDFDDGWGYVEAAIIQVCHQ